MDKDEKELPRPSIDELKKLYIEQNLTLTEVSEKTGISRSCVWWRLRKAGVVTRKRTGGRHSPGSYRRGKDSLLWKGGVRHTRGYIQIHCPDHPFAAKNGYVYEHRLVVEKKLGRYLLPSEKVHHKGGKFPLGSIENKQDNREENLRVFSCQAEHLTTIVPISRLDALELKVKDQDKQIRLLKWHIQELEQQLQFKMGEKV